MGFTVLAFLISTIAVIIGIKKFPHHITWQEGLAVVTLSCCLVATVYFVDNWSKGADKMILNGQVTSKEKNRVSCSHSYSCNCRTVTSGKTTSVHCDTCYEHLFDYDWDVHSTVGGVTIDRVDRQGVKEPKRWTEVKIGEAFSIESTYYNFVKAAPLSIFNREAIESTVAVPGYIAVRDYYRINRIIKFGVPEFNTAELNNKLNDELRVLGPAKKANIVVIFHNKDSKFAEIVKAKSLGGKINDITVLIGLNKDYTFKDVNVYSWSKNDMVNVVMRDLLLDVGKYDALAISNAISKPIKSYYVHRSIKEFEYLEEEVQVSSTVMVVLLMLCFFVPCAGLYAAYRIDSGDEWRLRRHFGRY